MGGANGFLLVVPAIITLVSHHVDGSIQCYKCTTTKPPFSSNEPVRLCSDFDYSDKFIVDCHFSTFCMKRYFTAKIPNLINATERDCASQKYTTQTFKDNRWQPEVVIEEPYSEGCSVVDDKGFRTSTTTDCYCKSYLCNSSDTCKSRFVLFMAVIVLITYSFVNAF